MSIELPIVPPRASWKREILMIRLRLMLLGLGLFVLAWSANSSLRPAAAQVASAPNANSNGVGASMGLNLADRQLVKHLRDAENATAGGDDVAAVNHLQLILNLPQDAFFRPADELAGRFVSLKQQAELMLSRASPNAKRVYELQFGTEARKLFDQAMSERNVKLAEEVMRRFVHTAAGADAVYWLGSYHMDRADYESALQCLLRLRRLPASATFEPQLSLRAALCFYRTGRMERAQTLVRETAAKVKAPIKVAGQIFPAVGVEQQILAWLKVAALPQKSTATAEPTGWLMPRGNFERNLLLRSSPPVGKGLWNVPLMEWKVPDDQDPEQESELDVGPQILALEQVHLDKGVAPLPSASPLLVNDVVVARFFDHLAGFDVRTGQELWRSAENDRTFQVLFRNLGSNERFSNSFNRTSRSPRELFSVLLRQRAWEDLTFGTLSSDGELVYSIEDLGFLNDMMTPQVLLGAGMPAQPQHPLMMRDFNRLCAYEARTGKLKWEIGGPRGDIALPQAGTFFLGPPLPIDRQLMCLVENQGLIQLVVLEARTGKSLWTQILSQPTDNMFREPHRRRAGLTPALMGDLLVCPTGSGLVVTVDVASRALAWAYQYTAPMAPDGRDPRAIRMRLAMMGIPQVEMDPLRGAEVNEWQDGSPILAEGHVLLTPRDSPELHCLSLEDGKVAWRLPRKDNLYVAAVQSGLVIVVGSRSVEAIRLSDGSAAWPQPVPLMSQAGRGIVTESHILLPLATNEVVSIDLKTGRSLARTRVHDTAVLGNMIPGPGFIVSQSAKSLGVFRTLDSVAVETAQRLLANPQDAEALAQRGEYRLSQGDLAAGQADLRQSLKIRKSADTQTVLFESLLQGLQSDFAGHRSLLAELEQLAQSPAEHAALYRTWAEGLLAANELPQAFDVLLKLSDPKLGKPELERLDGHRSMRRDHWIRIQLEQLVPKVDEATRNRVAGLLRQRLTAALAEKDPEGLRNYLRYFGSHPLADEARQALADRLVSAEYSIEAEQLLSKLSGHSNPRIAGRALAVMIRELVKVEQGAECGALLDRLAKDFADVVCLDNQTGQQLAANWRGVAEPRVPFAEDWPTGRIEVSRENVPTRNPTYSYDVAIDGDPGPFFRHSQFKTFQDSMRAMGQNGWGEPQWSIPLSELGPISNISTYRAQVRNHLVLMTMGAQVCVISTLMTDKGVRAKTLWNSPLVEGPVSEQNQFFQVMIQRPGMIRPQLNRFDFRQNPVGTVGVIEDDTVVILRGRHLILADLLTGLPLWKRTDLVAGSEIFGDGEAILVVPPDGTEAQQIRRTDGLTLATVPVPPQMSRILTLNRSVLSFARDGIKNVLTFQLTDIPAKKQIWERTFDRESQFTVLSLSEMAVLEPSGLLSLIQLSDGQVRWQQKLTLAPNPKDLWVIPNGERLLVLNGEIPARNPARPAMVIGNNQVIIDGQAECLDRTTGKPFWTQRIEHFGLDYSLAQYLPCWLFTVRTANIQAQNIVKPEFHMMAIDKRSGLVVLKTTETAHISSYQAAFDPVEKQVQLTQFGSPNSVQHKLKYTDQPIDASPAKPETP